VLKATLNGWPAGLLQTFTGGRQKAVPAETAGESPAVAFVLEGRSSHKRPWVELARADCHNAAVRLFESAKRRFPRVLFFRMSRAGRGIWKSFR
jgi:hypothetical protein